MKEFVCFLTEVTCVRWVVGLHEAVLLCTASCDRHREFAGWWHTRLKPPQWKMTCGAASTSPCGGVRLWKDDQQPDIGAFTLKRFCFEETSLVVHHSTFCGIWTGERWRGILSKLEDVCWQCDNGIQISASISGYTISRAEAFTSAIVSLLLRVSQIASDDHWDG